MDYKILSQTKNYIKLQLEDEPELVHLIKSGHKNEWFRFLEDGYEIEPWQSGIDLITDEMILKTYQIDVNKPNKYIEDNLSKIQTIAEEVYSENPDEIVYREADVYDFFKKII